MNTSGFYALKRTIKEWGWYHDPKMFTLFMHLLIDANYEDGEWEGHTVKRGQLVTSIQLLSVDTGLSKQEVRTCMKKLGGAGEVLSRSIGKRSILTICNYDKYEERQHDSNTDATQMQHVSNTDATQEQHAIIKQYNKGTKEQEDKEKDILSKEKAEQIERLYEVYPTKCPITGRSLGKCSKNKKQIETLLKTRTQKDIELTMREYIVDCKNHGTYLKNFSTFLNQFPERKKPQEQSAQQPQPQPQPQEQPTLPFDAPPTEQPVKKASPEMIAIDAMSKGMMDASVVRKAIEMVWDGITEDKIQHALWNAGYQI